MAFTVNDRRSLILNRLEVLLSGLTVPLIGSIGGISSVIVPGNIVRNRNELPKEKTPGIILLDADEVKDPRSQLPARGLQERAVPTNIFKMTPEIYVVLETNRPITMLNAGTDLNTARLAILAAVLPDKQLQNIVGANGNIVYDGCVTDFARNRTMKGQMGLSITFTYPLIQNEYLGINLPSGS
jgi:hypothetical protein